MSNCVLVLLFVFFLSVLNTHAADLPVFDFDQKTGKLTTKVLGARATKKILNKTFKRAIKRKNRRKGNLKLDWLVLGLGADVRKGFMRWNVATSMAMEFHLRVLK